MPDLVLSKKALTLAARFVDWLVLEGVEREKAAKAVKAFTESVAGKKPVTPIGAAPLAVQSIMLLYGTLYGQLHPGEHPHITPADYSTVARLLKVHGPRLLTQRLNELAAVTDPWLKGQGFTFTVLERQWARLAASSPKTHGVPRCEHTPRCATPAAHSQRYLADMRHAAH